MKSPPTICGWQDGPTVVVTVTVEIEMDVDTDVMVLAALVEGQAVFDMIVVVIVVEEVVQLGCVLVGLVVEDEELGLVEVNIQEQAELSLEVEDLQLDRKVGIPVIAV